MARTLTVDRLGVHYAGGLDPAIVRLSFELAGGASLAIIGPAGAGKSTLLHSIAGVLFAQEHATLEGRVRIGSDEPHSGRTMTAFPAVAMLPQEPRHLISGFVQTVEDELDLTLQQARIPAEQWDDRKRSILSQLPIAHLLARQPSTLSGGEIQIVAFAIAAVASPDILLLDEPVTSLDQGRQDDLTRFLRRRPHTMSVIVADMVLHPAVLACERILVLEHGAVVFSDTREAFWERLPEFQDLVTLGAWLELWHKRRTISQSSFHSLLERLC